MKFKKLTAAAMAAAMLAVAAPICGTASASTQTEYGCEWVDVRPDSQYDLTMEKVEVDGKERYLLKLSGIPEAMLNYNYEIEFDHTDGKKYYRSSASLSVIIDVDNGDKSLILTTIGAMGVPVCYFGDTAEYINGPYRQEPDENGKYCYYRLYNDMLSYPDRDARETTAQFVNDEDGTAHFECYLNSDDPYAIYLSEAKSTTVMTYAGVGIGYSLGNDGETSWGKMIGFLSDGTIIKGDGKYIDCDTKQEKQYEGISWCDKEVYLKFEIVDNMTDIPKETVKITVIDDSDTSSDPSDTTKEQSFHDETTDISVEGSFPEGTKLISEIKQVSDTKVSWDITLTDASGNEVQPKGLATVKLPLLESFKGSKVYVYRIDDDGTRTLLASTVEGDYVVFKTAHFTEYMLSTEDLGDTSEPDTESSYSTVIPGDTDGNSGSNSGNDQANTGIALAIAPAALACAAVIAASKKRK